MKLQKFAIAKNVVMEKNTLIFLILFSSNSFCNFKEFLQIPHFAESLRYRFTWIKIDENAKKDEIDGDEYLKLCEPGNFLSDSWNFPFIMNTDGCSVTES